MIRIKLDKVLVVLLIIYAIALASTINNPPHVDEATHSFVGMFLKDLVNDWLKQPTLSFSKIYEYTISYLAYYPKISLHYPPLPQAMFSLAYSIFGVTLQVSRLVIIVLSVILMFVIYLFTQTIFKNRMMSLIATSLLMTSTIVINMSILAMQEIPFLFFFTLTMLWLYVIKDKEPKIKNFVLLAILIAATTLTKWQAITILPVVLTYVLFFERRLLKYTLASFALATIILAPYYLILWKTDLLLLPFTANLEADVNEPTWKQLEGWTYYLFTLVREQFFLPLGTIIVISTIVYLVKKYKDWSFFATWILVVYLIMVTLHNKDTRYTINFLPAFVIPASYVIYKIAKTSELFIFIVIGLVLTQVILAFVNIKYGFPEVYEIAKYIIQDKEGNVLINSGLGTASPFIFEMARNSDFEHQVFRPCVIEFLNESYSELTRKFDIKYVVVDKEQEGFTKRQQEFSQYLVQGGEFSLAKDFSRFYVMKNGNYMPKEKNEICNYVCATREFVCSKFKIPSDALK